MDAESGYWERRYYSAIERFSTEERQWQHLYVTLRKLVQRLLLAGRGRSEALDRALIRVRDAVGETIDEDALDSVTSVLSEAIRALEQDRMASGVTATAGALSAEVDMTAGNDGTAPLPAPAQPTSEGGAAPVVSELLLRILDRLALVPELTEAAARLRAAIANAAPDALAGEAERIADLVNRQCALLIADKARVESLLLQVTEHLGEIERYLDGHGEHLRAGRNARQALHEQVQAEVERLHDDARDADRLDALQQQVRSRLDAIGEHLTGFQNREDARERDWQQRTERMSARIRELEQTTADLEHSLREQKRQAITDQLTGVANRVGFDERIAEACRRLKRSGLAACLLVLDIDRFKGINDQYGHATGDRALRIVAQQLQTQLRETDFLARYGGEEFVILLEAVNGVDGLKVADKLREHIGALRFRVHDNSIRISVSIGVTALRAGDTPEAAFDRADRALYAAKDNGRDRCELA